MQPEMEPVSSSLVKEMGYDEENRELWLRLNNGGFFYVFSDVRKEVFEEMQACCSVGRYFQNHIRFVYSCRQEGGVSL